MASMKDEAMAEIKAMNERATKYQEGYEDGFSDGYDRAMADIEKLKKLAVHEMLKGIGK